MPGRQAHGRSLLATLKKDGRSKKRGPPRAKNNNDGGGSRIDLLALAEKQLGSTKNKGVRLRDLDIEQEHGKRRRQRGDDSDENDGDVEGGHLEGASKRQRRNRDGGGGDEYSGDDSDAEMHSDSSGNEWHLGVGSNDDDSEIDSDEAFGESDDEIVDAFAFRGSKNNRKTQRIANKKNEKNDLARKDSGSDEDECFSDGFDDDEDVGDDGADLGDEAIDLAQALDQGSSDEEQPTPKKGSKQARRPMNSSVSDSEDSKGSAKSDSSDSNDSQDGDHDSDDDTSSESSGFASGEGDDDDDDMAKFDALKEFLSTRFGKSEETIADDDDVNEARESAQTKVSLGDLGLLGVKDPVIKKSLRLLSAEDKAAKKKKLDVPLARMEQDRLLRQAAAEKSHETLGRWIETVKHNRRAEHLEFPVAGSLASSGLNTLDLVPINHKTAQTELEQTIFSIMEESGLGPRAAAGKEDQSTKEGVTDAGKAEKMLSPDELKQLISQRRREREIQSRETARAKRIKKIKSKAYRRVHRRERAKIEAAQAELEELEEGGSAGLDSDEEREAAHRRRAMERMGARHRESKWANRAKHTGRAAWDEEFRNGLVDMARQDEALRRRVERKGGDDDNSDDSDNSEMDDGDEEGADVGYRARLLRELHEANKEAGKEENTRGPHSALHDVPFMRRAEEARRRENDAAATQLTREMDPEYEDSDEDGGDDDGDKQIGRRMYGQVQQQYDKKRSNTDTVAEADVSAGVSASAAVDPAKKGQSFKSQNPQSPERTAAIAEERNAWTEVRSSKSSLKKKGKEGKAPGGVLVLGDFGMTEAPSARAVEDDDDTSSSGSSDSDNDSAGEANVRSKTVRATRTAASVNGPGVALLKASGAPVMIRQAGRLTQAMGEDDAEAEFAREKARQAAEEAVAEVERATHGERKNDLLPGWGSWGGEGLTKRERDRNKAAEARRRKELATAAAKPAARRDAKLDRVIISERHVKKNDLFLASQLPHEFENRNQYERALRLPIGPEWGTKSAFQEATKPRLLTKQGVVLPMAKPTL